MKVETVYVKSVEEFVSRVRTFCDKWDQEELWYRGISSSRYSLRPSLYRGPYHKSECKDREKEDELRIEFSRRGPTLISERSPSDEAYLEWYILMRHNGVPTRLLDWTEASLVALYFAVRPSESMHSKAGNAAVWVLDPEWLNMKVIGKREILRASDPKIHDYLPPPRTPRKKLNLRPLAFLPPYLITQMLTQRSVFTIHGNPNGFDEIASARGKKRLGKIVIRPHDTSKDHGFKDILYDLASCGVTESTVFPTLVGLGKEVTEFFWHFDE